MCLSFLHSLTFLHFLIVPSQVQVSGGHGWTWQPRDEQNHLTWGLFCNKALHTSCAPSAVHWAALWASWLEYEWLTHWGNVACYRQGPRSHTTSGNYEKTQFLPDVHCFHPTEVLKRKCKSNHHKLGTTCIFPPLSFECLTSCFITCADWDLVCCAEWHFGKKKKSS